MKLYHNGTVYVGRGRFAEAFTVEGGMFGWVGTGEEAQRLLASGEVLPQDAEDLNGAFVCAGFNDSHMHLLNYGQALAAAKLSEHTGSLRELIDYFREYAAERISGGADLNGAGTDGAETGDADAGDTETSDTETSGAGTDGAESGGACSDAADAGRLWLLGRGWNEDYFADEHRLPNRHDLDKVSTDHPVVAVRACGHCLVTNTKALSLLSIDENTAAPAGGRIGEAGGQPNGQFFDNAMDLVLPKIPAPSLADIKSMLCHASAELNKYGVTGCQTDDYCVFRQVPYQTVDQAYRELAEEGRLTVRVYEQCNFTTLDDLVAFVEGGNVTGVGDEMFRYGPLKMLGDGSLGAGTALLSRPYADSVDKPNAAIANDEVTPTDVAAANDANTAKDENDADGSHAKGYGLAVFDQKTMDEMVSYANAAGMQVAIHAIGDRCLDMVLDACEKALRQNPRPDHRHGVVHCQITRPEQLDRIAKLNMRVYAQSIFLDYDIDIVEQKAGAELAKTSYAWKTLMQKGVDVSNGTDCPVELPDALACIQCGVTRKKLSGDGDAYLPEEAFSVQEALDSYTLNGARASFEEDIKGSIEAGKLADFVILQKNPFEVAANDIADIKVLRTVLGGKVVYITE